MLQAADESPLTLVGRCAATPDQVGVGIRSILVVGSQSGGGVVQRAVVVMLWASVGVWAIKSFTCLVWSHEHVAGRLQGTMSVSRSFACNVCLVSWRCKLLCPWLALQLIWLVVCL